MRKVCAFNGFYVKRLLLHNFSCFRPHPSVIGIALVLFVTAIDQALALETVTVKCGTSQDVTNVGTGNNTNSKVPVTDIKFNNLDHTCYGEGATLLAFTTV